MDFTEFTIWKALALLAIAGIVSFWRGFTGRPARGLFDNQAPEVHDAAPPHQRQELEVLERVDDPKAQLPGKG